MWKQNVIAACVTQEKLETIHTSRQKTLGQCAVMLPAVLRAETTREGVTSASVVLSEKLCVENQTNPNPSHPRALVSARVTGGFSGGERGSSCRGQGNGGILTSGQKALVCELQQGDGPAAILAQPSIKEMLGFMLAQKNPKKPLSQFQRGIKRPSGALLKGFPLLSELFNLTWCG